MLLITVGVRLLSCVCCIQSALANVKCTSDKRTRSYTTAKRHDFEKHSKRDHRRRERENVESLMVLWRSAVAADDGDVGTVLSRYAGMVVAVVCHHE